MTVQIRLKQKAAQIAAFCFIVLVSSQNIMAKAIEPFNLEKTKNKLAEYLEKKQKTEALVFLNELLKQDSVKTYWPELGDILETIAKSFLSKEAQENFETSLNLTLENPKESKKFCDLCLNVDPNNFECLEQKARLAYRAKNQTDLNEVWIKIQEIGRRTKFESWMDLVIHKDKKEFDFNHKNIIKKINEPAAPLSHLKLLVLEIERAFRVHNFSRAREILEYLQKQTPDWPDLDYYKNKIQNESSEGRANSSTVVTSETEVYQTNCKNLSRSLFRKFRYDFDLCLRGAQQ